MHAIHSLASMITKSGFILSNFAKWISLAFKCPHCHDKLLLVTFIMHFFPYSDPLMLTLGMIFNFFYHCFEKLISVFLLHRFSQVHCVIVGNTSGKSREMWLAVPRSVWQSCQIISSMFSLSHKKLLLRKHFGFHKKENGQPDEQTN